MPLDEISRRYADTLFAQAYDKIRREETLQPKTGLQSGAFLQEMARVGLLQMEALAHARADAIENTRGRPGDYEHEGSRERPLARGLYDVNVQLIGSAATMGDVLDNFHFTLDLRGEAPILKRDWTR